MPIIPSDCRAQKEATSALDRRFDCDGHCARAGLLSLLPSAVQRSAEPRVPNRIYEYAAGIGDSAPINVRLAHFADASRTSPEVPRSANWRPEQVQQIAWTKLRLLNDLVGAEENGCRQLDADRLRGFEIDRGFEIRDLLYREIGGLRSAQDLGNVMAGSAER